MFPLNRCLVFRSPLYKCNGLNVNSLLLQYEILEKLVTLRPVFQIPSLIRNLILIKFVYYFQASQNYSQTPSKANHPSKYDYTSPVKTLKKEVQISTEQRGNKKRVQLFASPRKEAKNNALSSSPAQLQEPGTIELSDDLIFQKLGGDIVDTKMACLAERLSTPVGVGKSAANRASNDKLKIGQFNSNNNSSVTKINSRRSLDSAGSNSKPLNSGPPHSRGSG